VRGKKFTRSGGVARKGTDAFSVLLLEEGIRLFNAAAWFRAHEVWEDLWRETQGEARLFYQGLVQVAVGLHHVSHGNLRGGRRVLERGMEKLKTYPSDYRGIDNRRLQRDLEPLLSGSRPAAVRIRVAGDPDPASGR
jgi:predicted metal-dependent hydrolase